METNFQTIDPHQLNDNVFTLIGKEWMLIASGDSKNYNMMTASWGGLGVIWNKPVAIIFVRPQRYTLEYLENNDLFTLNFFDNSYRKVLNLLGSKSGREINKMETEGIVADSTSNNTVFFRQARLVMECRKVYFDDINHANILNDAAKGMYPAKDYHRMYFGEVINVLISK
jgi:flavin reductase (DIM6/NTAB) family NADH-FMN oxidoreductase RutF